MIDRNGKEIKIFTVGNGRFFINLIEVPLHKYLEEKSKYFGYTRKEIITCEKEK